MTDRRADGPRPFVPAIFILLAASVLVPEGYAEDGAALPRVVSVGGSITEIVYALGVENRLVAVDTTSTWPPAATDHPNVGYMRQLSAEAILALGPDLILVEQDAGPPEALHQLRAAGAEVVAIPDDPSPGGVLAKVAAVATALEVEDRGADLSERLAQEFAALAEGVAAVDETPSVLFLLSIGRGAPLAAGRDTSAAGIVALAGGINAVNGFDRYKPLSREAAAGAAPDVLLVTERTLDLLGGADALLARPEVSLTPAGRDGRLVVMDGLLLLGFGPRTPQAIRLLAAALHPNLDLPAAE